MDPPGTEDLVMISLFVAKYEEQTMPLSVTNISLGSKLPALFCSVCSAPLWKLYSSSSWSLRWSFSAQVPLSEAEKNNSIGRGRGFKVMMFDLEKMPLDPL